MKKNLYLFAAKAAFVVAAMCMATNVLKAQNTFPSSGSAGIGVTDFSNTIPGFQRMLGLARGNAGVYGITFTDPGNGWTISLATEGSEKLSVKNNGNVGIGTTSPYTKLDVAGSIYTALHKSTNIHDVNERGTYYIGSKSGSSDDGFTGMKMTVGAVGSGNGGSIAFQTWGYNISTTREVMVINPQGNVGIGTSDPQYKLSVAGDIGVDNAITLKAKNSSGSYETFMNPRWSDNKMYINYGSAGFNIRNNGNTSTMYMTDDNKVGIGTTTPSTKLDINNGTTNGAIKIVDGTQGAGKVLTSDANGLATWKELYVDGNKNGKHTVALGMDACRGTLTNAVGLGDEALKDASGAGNIGIGAGALIGASGGYNIGIGISMGCTNGHISGYNNVLIGTYSFNNGYSGNNNIGIGAYAEFPSQTKSNQLNIGNWIFGDNGLIIIGSDNATSTQNLLDVHGSAHFNNDLATTDATMTHVTINTDTVVNGCALTVAGPTYIGDWRDIETGKIKPDNLGAYYLWVKGGVVSEDYVVAPQADWRDYVFAPEYKLPALSEVESFIKTNRHLEGVPSESDVKQSGYNVASLSKVFLEKIEHLYLYSIAQEKKVNSLQEINTNLKKENERQQQLLSGLEQRIAALEKSQGK